GVSRNLHIAAGASTKPARRVCEPRHHSRGSPARTHLRRGETPSQPWSGGSCRVSRPAIVANEDSLAEQPTLEWLTELGWGYIHGATIAPDGFASERASFNIVVLLGRLRSAVSRLNPDLSPTAVDQVVADVVATTSPNVVEDHAAFHELLLTGVPV